MPIFDIILGIFSFFESGSIFNFDTMDINKFFYDKSKEYPLLFRNLLFDDPEFPYSEQLMDALVRLEDACFISRTGLSLNKCKIVKHLYYTNQHIPDNIYIDIKNIADDFKHKFKIEA